MQLNAPSARPHQSAWTHSKSGCPRPSPSPSRINKTCAAPGCALRRVPGRGAAGDPHPDGCAFDTAITPAQVGLRLASLRHGTSRHGAGSARRGAAPCSWSAGNFLALFCSKHPSRRLRCPLPSARPPPRPNTHPPLDSQPEIAHIFLPVFWQPPQRSDLSRQQSCIPARGASHASGEGPQVGGGGGLEWSSTPTSDPMQF